jgi:hypothetical protein
MWSSCCLASGNDTRSDKSDHPRPSSRRSGSQGISDGTIHLGGRDNRAFHQSHAGGEVVVEPRVERRQHDGLRVAGRCHPERMIQARTHTFSDARLLMASASVCQSRPRKSSQQAGRHSRPRARSSAWDQSRGCPINLPALTLCWSSNEDSRPSQCVRECHPAASVGGAGGPRSAQPTSS